VELFSVGIVWPHDSSLIAKVSDERSLEESRW